jgi:hypothetical protein
MMHFTVHELDFKRFRAVELEVVGGSRPRLTFFHSDNRQKFFFKTYTHTPREVWAECLASHIAELMDIKAQQVTIKIAPKALEKILRKRYPKSLPKDWRPVGSFARNIFPKRVETTYGGAIVETPTEPLTLEEIESRMRSKYYAADDLLQNYADMVIFDALIGNMDRHHENWGVCADEQYRQQVLIDRKQLVPLRYFTPLFDHGSSLMFELSDENVQNFLDNEQMLINYVEKSKFGFILNTEGKKTNMFDIIEKHIELKTFWGKRFKKSLIRIKRLDLLEVASLVLKMPSLEILEYNSLRRKLLFKSLHLRYNKLIEIYEKAHS